MKTTDQILQEFREKFNKKNTVFGDYLFVDIEQFITKALEQAYNQGFVDGSINMEKRKKAEIEKIN